MHAAAAKVTKKAELELVLILELEQIQTQMTQKGFTRIPPVLADTTSRPACHALRRRAHGGRSKGLTTTIKCTKRKQKKHDR